MKKTTNYGLALYDKEDKMNITAEENSLNANMKIIDNALKEKANSEDIPTKVSELENDSGFINSYTETDPTVPQHVKNIKESDIENWNKKSEFSGNYNDLTNKPTIPTVPTKVSELENDKNYLTNVPSEFITDTELKAKGYATESFVSNKIAEAELSGSDVDLSGLATKDELNNKVDKVTGKSLIADTEITRLASVINYDDTEIKNTLKNKADKTELHSHTNKTVLDGITAENIENWNSKSNFDGNYNSLTNKPTIPSKVSELSNDKNYLTTIPSEYVTETELNNKGYLTEHQDISNLATKNELHSHSNKTLLDGITQTNITNWNKKSEFSGNYNDLTNKPTIPTVPANISAFNNDKGYLTSVPSTYKTKTENDSLYQAKGNYLTSYTEKDPTVPSHVKNITTTDISNWNGKSTFSGSYNDLTNKPTIPTKTSQLTNDSSFISSIPSEYVTETELSGKGYLTEHQDLSGYARTTELPTKTSQLTNDSGFLTKVELTQEQLDEIADAVVEAQKMEFVNSTDECTDTSKQYVLPDGYIYAYMQKTQFVKHDAMKGTIYLNRRVSANATMNTDLAQYYGMFATELIEVDKTWTSCILSVSGLEKLYPTWYSAVYVWYYDASGNWLGYNSAGTLGLPNGEVEIPLPISVNIVKTYWTNVAYIRLGFGIKNKNTQITTSDIEGLVVNLDKLDKTEAVYGWYSTGHMYSKDEYSQAIEQNASNIETLQTDVDALKEAVKTTPSQSGAVWYAVGDSITKGYGVGADKCWVKYVLDYNGYDKEKSLNLGISGLGFAKSDPNYHKTARTVVDENSFTNVDLVTIAIGINDWKEPFSIDTVKSEMRYCFEKILTDNPCCKIFFIVPFNIWLKGSASTNWALGYSGSDVTGGTLQNFIDTQKEVCKEYGIQIIDLTNEGVINKVNIETVLYDKVHPNEQCHIALGRELARRITYA